MKCSVPHPEGVSELRVGPAELPEGGEEAVAAVGAAAAGAPPANVLPELVLNKGDYMKTQPVVWGHMHSICQVKSKSVYAKKEMNLASWDYKVRIGSARRLNFTIFQRKAVFKSMNCLR